MIKQIGIYILLILLLTGLFVGMGTLSALIPHEAVAENIQSSSEKFGVGIVRNYLTEGEHSTVVDYYADAVLMTLSWYSDADRPLHSYITAQFRDAGPGDQTLKLHEAINGAPIDGEYSRYWHGMLVFLRPLLTVMDITGIRIVNAVTLVLLGAAVLYLLYRRRLYALMAGYLTAAVVCYCYIVPLCMEYMMPFVLFHLFSIFLLLWEEKLSPYLAYIFMIFGALTCYFDFLTTETLVFTVPMTIIICLRIRDGRFDTFPKGLLTTVKYGLHWLFGYAVFYPIKWLITSLVMGESTFAYSLQRIMQRTNNFDMAENVSYLDAFVSSVGRLFPFTLYTNGWNILYSCFLIAVVYAIVWMCFRRKIVSPCVWILSGIMLLPYLRYVLLANHTIVHGFMVFRAQIGTIMALFAFASLTMVWKEEKTVKKTRKKGHH